MEVLPVFNVVWDALTAYRNAASAVGVLYLRHGLGWSATLSPRSASQLSELLALEEATRTGRHSSQQQEELMATESIFLSAAELAQLAHEVVANQCRLDR